MVNLNIKSFLGCIFLNVVLIQILTNSCVYTKVFSNLSCNCQQHDGKQVAVKVQNGIKHFRKEECEILIKARHKNVVALYGWEEVIDFSHKNICSCNKI